MSGIPTAVLRAEAEADAAIEADASTFDASLLSEPSGSDGITIQDGGVPRQQPIDGYRRAEQGQGARADGEQTAHQDSSEAKADVQKIEMTQEELAQRVAAGKREIQGLFESRLGNMTQISEENKNLRKRVNDLEREIAAKTANERPDVHKLRDEHPEFAGYDDEELITITSAIRRTVAKELEKVIPGAARNIRSEIESGNKATAMRSFVSRMEAKYPGFVKLDSENDAAWLSFLDADVPGTGGRVKYGSPAKEALESMDERGLSEIVDEFSKQSGFTFGSRGDVDPRVAAQVRPRQSNAGTARQNQSKPVFTVSQVARFNREYNSGAIKRQLSPDAIEALRTDIESAEAEGRIIDG
jgi:hypothetical protein